jgi:hypothetical protein
VARFYLSRDPALSRRDVHLEGAWRLRSLRRNQTARGAAAVRVPATTAPGGYFLIACADAGRKVRERSERNNCRSSSRRTVVVSGVARPSGLYAPASPFNTPIPAHARVDPNSAQYVAALKEVHDERGFTISLRAWTVPVYEAPAATRRVDVRLTASWRGADWMQGVPLPAAAAPDPADDGHMTVLDRARGCEYDFYRARKIDGGGRPAGRTRC